MAQGTKQASKHEQYTSVTPSLKVRKSQNTGMEFEGTGVKK
jgi:hypothetical protein